MKVTLSLLALLLSCPVWAADVKVVPKDVLAWYDDTMGMYGDVSLGLDKAKNAADATKVLKKGSTAIQTLKLAPRYQTLKGKYPQFFDSQNDTAWVPPPDWAAVSRKYSSAVTSLGQGFQKVAAWMQDSALAAALEEFSEAAGAIGGESGS